MKLFITGLLGFVGQNLAYHLAKQGHEIVGLIHDYSPRSLEALRWERSMVKVHGDVRDFKRMREILFDYKPDGIVHLAGQAMVGKAHVDPYSTFDVNVNGTIALLEAWREACSTAHFLHFSTDKVYGNGLGKKETDPIHVTSDSYAASKAAADIIAQSYLPEITITRSCNIYGPGDREPSRLVPHCIDQCLHNAVPILRMPYGKREYIYVEDVCKILAWMLEQHKTGIWNIGSGRVVPNWYLASEIINLFPALKGLAITEAKQKIQELSEQSLNTEKLCGEMDCLAFTTLQAGIRKTVEYWRTQHPLLSSAAA